MQANVGFDEASAALIHCRSTELGAQPVSEPNCQGFSVVIAPNVYGFHVITFPRKGIVPRRRCPYICRFCRHAASVRTWSGTGAGGLVSCSPMGNDARGKSMVCIRLFRCCHCIIHFHRRRPQFVVESDGRSDCPVDARWV